MTLLKFSLLIVLTLGMFVVGYAIANGVCRSLGLLGDDPASKVHLVAASCLVLGFLGGIITLATIAHGRLWQWKASSVPNVTEEQPVTQVSPK